jgi:hypothetical protein
MDDAFMAALADGGFQIGELAKHYYPGGTDITALDYDEFLRQTNTLLKQENVIIYEAVIQVGLFFIRRDILVKTGNTIKLIEVKSKSYNKDTDSFFGTKVLILKEWRPYLEVVAFQVHVLRKAMPNCIITPHLMMTDKTVTVQTDGLNQKFKLVRSANNRRGVEVANTLTSADLKRKILITVPVDEAVGIILKDTDSISGVARTFTELYANDTRAPVHIGVHCDKCQFKFSRRKVLSIRESLSPSSLQVRSQCQPDNLVKPLAEQWIGRVEIYHRWQHW